MSKFRLLNIPIELCLFDCPPNQQELQSLANRVTELQPDWQYLIVQAYNIGNYRCCCQATGWQYGTATEDQARDLIERIKQQTEYDDAPEDTKRLSFRDESLGVVVFDRQLSRVAEVCIDWTHDSVTGSHGSCYTNTVVRGFWRDEAFRVTYGKYDEYLQKCLIIAKERGWDTAAEEIRNRVEDVGCTEAVESPVDETLWQQVVFYPESSIL